MGLAFLPLGCEITPEAVAPRVESAQEYQLPEAPPGVEAALTACVEEGVGRIKDKHYAVLFNVTSTSDGHVDSATVRDSMLADRGIESCMAHVLAGMSLPESITTFRPPVPLSMTEVAPGSRGLVGNVAALGGVLVNLVPIVITAAGVTILVGIGVLIYRDAKDRERCRKVTQQCIDKCTDERIPSYDPGGNPFHRCVKECKEAENCW